MTSQEPNLNSTTHWEPSRVVPGPHFLIQKVGKGSEGSLWGLQRGGWRPILARLRRADGRWYGRPGEAEVGGAASRFSSWPMQSALSVDNPYAEECTGARQMATSGSFRRRRSPALAGFRGGRSIGRLHGASCGPRGCATGFAFNPPSWSGGSASRRSRPRLPRRRGRNCLSKRHREACGRCSTGPMTLAVSDRER